MLHVNDAEQIKAEIQSLESDRGRVSPEILVGAAEREPDRFPACHARFNWDDRAAAHAHRLHQARELIRSVKVEIITESSTVTTVRYVRDPLAADEQGYVSVPQLRLEPENIAKLIAQEFARARTCLTRAETLAKALDQSNPVRLETVRVVAAALDGLPGAKDGSSEVANA